VVTGEKRSCQPRAGVRLLFGLFSVKAAQCAEGQNDGGIGERKSSSSKTAVAKKKSLQQQLAMVVACSLEKAFA
jgi:hypothetical protein